MNTIPGIAEVAPAASYETTRLNALRHGVLSRYTVLPWEDGGEYRALLDALVEEHVPEGPTEEHLVEELAGIIWRKRQLGMTFTWTESWNELWQCCSVSGSFGGLRTGLIRLAKCSKARPDAALN
jgi:hypothetical protein